MTNTIKEINREVTIRNESGIYQKGNLSGKVYSNDKVTINLNVIDKSFFSLERSNFFDCLIDIRNSLAALNWIILCNGARKDVYPSGMRRQMNKGLMAYQLTFGQAVADSDLVDIFQECSEENITTPELQKVYFEEWFESF